MPRVYDQESMETMLRELREEFDERFPKGKLLAKVDSSGIARFSFAAPAGQHEAVGLFIAGFVQRWEWRPADTKCSSRIQTAEGVIVH